MLIWRLTLGALFVAALVGLCWLDTTTNWIVPPLFVLALVVTVVAASETLWLLAAKDHRPIKCVVYVGSFAVVLSNWLPLFWPDYPAHSPLGRLGCPLIALAVVTIAAFIAEMRRYERPGGVMVNLALALLCVVYVGLLFTFVVQLRMVRGREWGLVALGSMIAVVKLGDIGAYTLGRLFGRHKMTPLLSPGKTWEGAVGAMLFAALGSWAAFRLLIPALVGEGAPQPPWWSWLSYGIIVGIAGMLGDLAESLFKRDMGRKDSSAWMPGFGGVLDLLDSLLLAAPVAYLCWICGLVAV